MYQNVKFTETEQHFIDSFMDDSVHPQSALYFEMVKRFVSKYVIGYETRTMLVTAKVHTLCDNILYKISSAEADQALEEILSGQVAGMITKPNVKRAVRTRRTARLSLDAFLLTHAGKVDSVVLKCIRDNPGLSRKELAVHCCMRMSTICAAVNRLYKEDLVRIAGVKYDEESKRNVETIEVR